MASKFNKALKTAESDFLKDLDKQRDPTRTRKLPEEGMKASNIEARMKKWFDAEEQMMFTGKNSGAIYVESNEHCREVSDFAAKYMYHNPLHLDTYKEVSKMEAEVLLMTSSLISKNKTYGVITSGGTESLIMSLYAYRKFYNRPRPNMYAPSYPASSPTPSTPPSTRAQSTSTSRSARPASTPASRQTSTTCAPSSTATPSPSTPPTPTTPTASSTPSRK